MTFEGGAYATATQVTFTPPKENRFSYEDGTRGIALRVNTDGGDSGAPIYNVNGLVIGMVTKKQQLSQAVGVPMKNRDRNTRSTCGGGSRRSQPLVDDE